MASSRCGKVCYPSRKVAKRALKRINHNRLIDFVLTDTYYCEGCSSWHHTSMPKQDSREIRRRLHIKKNRRP